MARTIAMAALVMAACHAGGSSGTTPATATSTSKPATPTAAPDEPLRCDDAIAGVWRARVFRAGAAKWDQVTLTIAHRGGGGDGDALVGSIGVSTWTGTANDPAPPLCSDGTPEVSNVAEIASGWLRDGHIDFEGREPERTTRPCGRDDTGTYHPDHFTGTVGHHGRRLITINDDGSVDRGRPHIFRRIACQAE